MATHVFSKPIVTDGLIFSVDPYNIKSYVDGDTTVSDMSTNSNNGTLTNGVEFNSNSWGFNGTNQFIDFGNITEFSFTGNTTVAGWVKVVDRIGNNVIIGKGDGDTLGWSVQITDSKLLIKTNSTVAESVLTDNNWHYFTGGYDGTNIFMYLDGEFVQQTVATLLADTDKVLSVGAGFTGAGVGAVTGFTNGDISLLKIYDRALSTTEIKQNYDATKYRFTYFSVVVAPLNPINFKSYYISKLSEGYVNSKTAASFDDANSEYLSSTSTDFDMVDEDFSWGGWVYVDSTMTTNTRYFNSKWEAAGNRSYAINYNTSTSLFSAAVSVDGTNGIFSYHSTTSAKSNWYFVVGVHDSLNDIIKVSVNGSSFSSLAAVGGPFVSTEPYIIGSLSHLPTTNGLTGKIDASFFYTRVLSLGDVLTLYNDGLGTDYDTLTDYNTSVSGLTTASLLFDGAADGLDIGVTLPSLSATTTGIWSAWVKPVDATPATTMAIVSFQEDTQITNFDLRITTAGKLSCYCRDRGTNKFNIITDSAGFSNNVWSHVALVQDGVLPVLYINGVAVAQTATISTDTTYWFNNFTATDNGRIGMSEYNSTTVFWFDGEIDSVGIWANSTAITPTSLFNSGLGKPFSELTTGEKVGLVSFYQMNNDTSFPQWDSSSNEYSATIMGAPTSTTGIVNDLVTNTNTQAICQSFDGSTEAFDIDNTLGGLSGNTTGLWSAWINPVDATPTGVEYILTFGDTDADTYINGYIQTTGTFNILTKNAGVNQCLVSTTAAAFTSGVWTHVCVVMDATLPVLYVNGIAVAQTNTISTDNTIWYSDLTGIDNGRIACRNKNSNGNDLFFNGSIDSVGFWANDSSITPASLYNEGLGKPFSELTTSEKVGLVSYYNMGSTEGANQTDESVNGYHASAIATPTSVVGRVEDYTISGIETSLISWWKLNELSGERFDSHGTNVLTDNNTVTSTLGHVVEAAYSGTYVAKFATGNHLSSLSTDLDVDENEDFAFGGWFKFDVTSQGRVMGRYANPGGKSYLLWHTATNFQFYIWNNAGTQFVVTGDVFEIDKWYFVVCTYDSTTDLQKISVNGGTYDTIANTTGAATTPTEPFKISDPSGSFDWQGSSSNTFFYDKTLTQSEVTTLYNNRVHLAYDLLSADQLISLVSYWDLDEESGNRVDSHGGNTLTDNNTVTSESYRQENVFQVIDGGGTSIDMVQATFAAQPLYLDEYLVFDGVDDYLENTTANIFSTDSSGYIFFAGIYDGNTNTILSSSDTGSPNYYVLLQIDATTGILGFHTLEAGVGNTIKSTTALISGDYYYGYFKSNGTSYEMNLNGSLEVLSITSGSDNGDWYSSVTLRDNLTIGVLKRNTSYYRTGKHKAIWVTSEAEGDGNAADYLTILKGLET